ncbi:acyl carrier protein [Roseibium aggregatum]|uniref:Acyl carrier protein n=1 Tax=Roseibium aggregatum TaxID=187304 RepID=A0A939EDJ6_9HYPH|nr:acyl carrier protein [Roseibium aggregatum]
MNRSSIFEQLSDIFLDVMDLDDFDLQDSTSAEEVEEWDSLSHVRLVAAVERSFKIRFSNAEIEKMQCVGDLVDSISDKLG